MTLRAKPQTNDFYVYIHFRADDGLPFYVGKGRDRRAWLVHGRNVRWQRIVKKHGLSVEIMADKLSEKAAFDLEKSTILALGRGFLCNCTDGGEGMSGHVKSEETLAKLRISLLGRKHSDATKALIGAKSKGKIFSAETRLKLSMANKGSVPTPETLAKRSVALSGRKFSDEHRAKISKALTGRKCDPAHIEKAAKACRIPVKCSNGNIFVSAKSAADWLKSEGFLKAVPSNITQCCKGNVKMAYGFSWSYALD